MANVLFVCLHNAGRSQISQALFERAAEGRHGARSAGTTPGERVHPEVVEVMREVGIDLADRVPHELTEDDARWAVGLRLAAKSRKLLVGPDGLADGLRNGKYLLRATIVQKKSGTEVAQLEDVVVEEATVIPPTKAG